MRFSLVVTTTDRPSLLSACVRAVLGMDFDDFELLVSDNFSQEPAAKILSSVNDKRLRTIRTDRRLAASDHWEFAWEHVHGEYVMYLGDDNALHPKILAFADRAIRDYDLDILSWRVGLYFHPDWNIEYGMLPTRGNVIGLDVGTTDQLYLCSADKVLAHFSRELRFPGCFPTMLNLLFRKSCADIVRERAKRFFWAPNPDTSSSYLALGVARPDRYAFFDGFGAMGGRSRHSNLASQLSRGKASRKVYDFVNEFQGQDMLPLHEPKFITMTNTLAATVSQAKALMPDYFGKYDFNRTTLARLTVDDLYVHRMVPWMDDPAFLAEVDQFIGSLPAADAAEIFAYRDECRARMQREDDAGNTGPGTPRSPDEARVSLLDFWRNAAPEKKALAWRLFRETGRNPLGRHWVSGGTTYVDMSLYGGRDIADAARSLPRVLANFNRHSDKFSRYYQEIGMLGEAVMDERLQRLPDAKAEQKTAAR